MSHDEPLAHLRARFEELRRKENGVTLLDGVARFLTWGIAGTLALAVLDILIWPEGTVRWSWTVVMFTGLATAMIVWIIRPAARLIGWLPSVDDVTLARRVGQRFPVIKDRLANALQLKQSGSPDTSASLVDAALQTVVEAIEGIDFTIVVNRERLKRSAYHAGVAVGVLAAAFAVFAGPLSLSYARLVAPHVDFSLPNSFEWVVTPGNTQTLQGEAVEIEMELHSIDGTAIPDRIRFDSWLDGTDKRTTEWVIAETAGRFRVTLPGLRQNTWFAAEVDDPVRKAPFRSDDFLITVLKRPNLKRLEVEVVPPGYSGLSPQVLDENAGDVTALKGSRVIVRTEATKPLDEAALVFSDSTRRSMEIQTFAKHKAVGEFILRTDGRYNVWFKDHDRLTSRNPVEYRLSVIQDDIPMIKLLAPDQDTDMNEDMAIRILAEARDDFGFSKLLLHHRLEKTGGFREPEKNYTAVDLTYLMDKSQLQQTLSYVWDFASLKLQPEDVMTFYLEIFDNDAVSGPKSATSAIITMRFPSLEEILAEVNKEQDQNLLKAEELLKETDDIHKELDELQQELLKDKKLDWQDKEKAKQLADKQETLQRELQDLKQSLEQMTQRMDENNLLSQESLDKYRELQKLMAELQNEEMLDAIRKMQEALKQNLNLDQMKDALKNFKFDQEQFKKNMDRTVELLKRLKAEQTFEQLKKQTEDLHRRQQELNELSKDAKLPNERDALANEQKKLEKSVDQLQQKTQELKDLVRSIDPNFTTKELDKAIEQLKQRGIQQKMEQSAKSLAGEQAQDENDEQNRDAAAQELDSLASQMADAQQEYLEQQNEQVMNAMQKIIYDLLEISKGQEGVMDESALLHALNPRYRLMTQRQSEVLSNMSKVTENIIALSNRTFHIGTPLGKVVGSALANMNTAVKDMEERNASQVQVRQMNAMNDVNEAVKMLLQSMNQMQQGASGTGLQSLLQQLEQMAGQQGQINSGMQGLFNQGNPGSLSLDQQAQLGRMLAEQEAVRRSLEGAREMADEQNNLKGQLDNLAKEMDEVIKDMQDQNVNRKTLQRQQRILQRMLDATRSMQEKDYSEKRRGERGKDYQARSPRELPSDLLDRKARLREELLRLKREGYSKDYEDLIRKYFEALGETGK